MSASFAIPPGANPFAYARDNLIISSTRQPLEWTAPVAYALSALLFLNCFLCIVAFACKLRAGFKNAANRLWFFRFAEHPGGGTRFIRIHSSNVFLLFHFAACILIGVYVMLSYTIWRKRDSFYDLSENTTYSTLLWVVPCAGLWFVVIGSLYGVVIAPRGMRTAQDDSTRSIRFLYVKFQEINNAKLYNSVAIATPCILTLAIIIVSTTDGIYSRRLSNQLGALKALLEALALKWDQGGSSSITINDQLTALKMASRIRVAQHAVVVLFRISTGIYALFVLIFLPVAGACFFMIRHNIGKRIAVFESLEEKRGSIDAPMFSNGSDVTRVDTETKETGFFDFSRRSSAKDALDGNAFAIQELSDTSNLCNLYTEANASKLRSIYHSICWQYGAIAVGVLLFACVTLTCVISGERIVKHPTASAIVLFIPGYLYAMLGCISVVLSWMRSSNSLGSV